MHWCGGLLLLVIIFALTACGPAEFSRHAAVPAEPPHTAPAERPSVPSPERAVTFQAAEIRRQLENENYRSALNLLRKDIRRGLSEEDMAEEYVVAVNGLLGKAELYRQQGVPEKAGGLFRLAHDGFPKTEAVANKIVLTPSEITSRIEDCAGQLMERGLAAYRAGDLDGAIQTWKTIQTFSPTHQPSRKAVETAEVQRSNLEKVRPKN